MFTAATTGIQAEITIATIADPNSPIIAIATDKEGKESVAVIGIKDANGNTIRITGYVYLLSDGTSLELKLDSNGIPVSLTENSGKKLLFSNYSNGTITITVYDQNNNQIGTPKTVPINQHKLDEGIQLRSSLEKIEPFTTNHLASETSTDNNCTNQLLYNVILAGVKGAGLYISALALAATIIWFPATATTAVIVIAGTSIFLGTLSMLPLADVDNKVFRVFRVVQTKFEEAICVSTPGFPTNIIGCMNLLAEKVVQVFFKPCVETIPPGTPTSYIPSRPPDAWLGIGIGGNGRGNVVSTNQPGINCPGDCSNIYPTDLPVTLKATAQTGSTFKDWSGACSGTSPEDTVLMYRDKAYTAFFKQSTPDISGSWNGSWWVSSPSACSEYSGDWSANFTVTNGIISGTYTGGGYSGPVSGTWDGTTATWSVQGGGGLSFQGTVSGNSVSGTWWGGDDCYDDHWNNLGPTSGGFEGSKQTNP